MNTCELSPYLPTLQQYVTTPTRSTRTLDQCFGNIPGAYKSVSLPVRSAIPTIIASDRGQETHFVNPGEIRGSLRLTIWRTVSNAPKWSEVLWL
ncbi:hypothetical protein AAFF_G00075070 [Aldrovandia affinis]|uniref:Uncharacterized protein n=1 Tax=Aldrovandia affinis TaxID=143900 RepID=A0AAD7WCV3_9TELE|nr:hypothetical protein AAFF_G00075070 [Aldrovandia affinis]